MKVINKQFTSDCFRFSLRKNDKEPDWFLREIGNLVLIEQNGFKMEWFLKTSEGNKKISKGDYIVKDMTGKIDSYKPKEFEQLYEIIKE